MDLPTGVPLVLKSKGNQMATMENQGANAALPGNGEKKMSTGAKVALGCGCGCLVLVGLLVGGGAVGYHYAMAWVDEQVQPFEQRGFERVTGQQLLITSAPSKPTVYVGQIIKITCDCDVEIAIVGQMAEIHGKMSKKVYFRGQMLVIQPQAKLLQGLDYKAQVVQKFGKIKGEITGEGQLIDPQSQPKQAPGP